jgi:hypothetical protein
VVTFYDADRVEWRIVRVLDVEPLRPGEVEGVFVGERIATTVSTRGPCQ